jgi:hypothetical protein
LQYLFDFKIVLLQQLEAPNVVNEQPIPPQDVQLPLQQAAPSLIPNEHVESFKYEYEFFIK